MITGEDYRTTATAPVYDLVLAGRMDRVARRSLVALVKGGAHYPDGSLFSDREDVGLPNLEAMASNRCVWRAKVASLV